MSDRNALRIAVLMGGVSGERAVSLKSGRAVTEALRHAGHEAIPYDVKDTELTGLSDLEPDAAFVALHGLFGEDGTVQRMLEQMGIPYTGSDPDASRVAMDKAASKAVFVLHAVPTPDYVILRAGQPTEAARGPGGGLDYPLVCKPANGGSSLGVSIVRKAEHLLPAVAAAREYDRTVIIEKYVRGREITIGVLEGEALPMIELITAREFFDYEAKYNDKRTRYVTPVALLPTVYRNACDVALRACRAIGCRHMARVDMVYGYDGSIYVLEVNTIPGFTERSLLPMAAAEAGTRFPELCDRIVRAALRDAAAARKRRRMTA